MSNHYSALLQSIHSWDVNLFQRWQVRLHLPQHMRLVRWAQKVSFSADGWPYLFFAFACYLIDPSVGGLFLKALLIAFLFERCIYQALKRGFKRRRPPAALPNFKSVIVAADEFSLPSGHTSGAFVFVTTCLLVFGPVVLPAYLWAGTVALSRISLGVHFPMDTVMGALLGTPIAFFTYFHFVL